MTLKLDVDLLYATTGTTLGGDPFVARRENSRTYECYHVEYRDALADSEYITTAAVGGRRITWELDSASAWEYPTEIAGDTLGEGAKPFQWEVALNTWVPLLKSGYSSAEILNNLMQVLEVIEAPTEDIATSALYRVAKHSPHVLTVDQFRAITETLQEMQGSNTLPEGTTGLLENISAWQYTLFGLGDSAGERVTETREHRTFIKLCNPDNGNLLLGFRKGERVHLTLKNTPVTDVDVTVSAASSSPNRIRVCFINGEEGELVAVNGSLTLKAPSGALGSEGGIFDIAHLTILPKICAAPGTALGYVVTVNGEPKDDHGGYVYRFNNYPPIDDSGYILCKGAAEMRYHMSEVSIWRYEEYHAYCKARSGNTWCQQW
jgi:hypothetical protein